jgi:fumarate hydratase class II
MAGQWGFFELNTMLPVAGYNLLQSIDLLANVAPLFGAKCIEGLRATDSGPRMAERGLGMATLLAAVIGYDRAAEVANEAARTGRSIREVALEQGVLPEKELDQLLDARRMTDR